MTRLLICIIVCLSVCIARFAHAGIIAVESDAGLPDKYITAICRDSRGLMWIGTRQGLCLYDGYRFLSLGGTLQNGTLISKLLYHAREDVLWAVTDKGLFSIHCSRLRITPAANAGGGLVTDICLEPGGRLYAAYNTGVIAAIDTDNRAKLIARIPAAGGAPDYARRIERDGDDMLSLQTAGRYTFYRLRIGSGLLQQEAPDTALPPAFFRKTIGDVRFIIREDELEIRDGKRNANSYPAATGMLKGVANVADVQLLPSGMLYALCKPSVLYRIDLRGNRKDTISSDVFTGRMFTCFYFDPEGIIWIGTNKGLIKITEDKQLFTRLLVQQPPVSVRSIAEDESGALYAGTYSGLYMSKDRGGHWANISRQLPYALLNVPGRYLYFAGGDHSFYRIDKRTAAIETDFYRKDASLKDKPEAAYALAEDNDGLIWIGAGDRLFTYDPATNMLAAWNAGGGLPAGIRIAFIKKARSGRLWLCTNMGLLELDKQKGIIWRISTASQPALSGNRTQYADEDAEGRLWVCTVNSGIDIISRDRRQVSVLRTEDGLSDNETYHLLRQGSRRVWISTFNGLSSYDQQTKTFCNYYAADGLTINEFNHSAFLRDRTGRMYFGTINGINAFYPDSITGTGSTTRLFASGITKWDNDAGAFISLPPADTASPIILRLLDHSLSFNLGLTDYHNPGNNVFRYRLKGLFDEWVKLDGQQALRLDGLAAGSYTLEIMALDSRGTPALNGLRYHIEVRQAFYKSWWFYLGMFGLASGLLWAFFALRLQHVKRVQRLREQIASDLHDEVGSLLTRITMTSDNLRYSKNAEADKTAKLEKIAALSRTAASSMSDVLWAIDARNDYTGNLADRMREHAEEMLLPLDIDLLFDFSVSQRMSISSGLRQQLYLIYKEAVNNIVKHSRATEVQVGYHHNESGFRLSIINNGYVHKEKASAKGQGLKNMQMRAGQLHASVTIEGAGDRFTVLVAGR